MTPDLLRQSYGLGGRDTIQRLGRFIPNASRFFVGRN